MLSNQASFALRVRVRPPDGGRLPEKLALKATLVVDDTASAAAFAKPHLLVSKPGEAPLLDAPPGRHSRAALLPAAPVTVVPDRSGGGGTAHFSLRLGDCALSDRCGVGRSLLKLLITPEIATAAEMEAICAGGLWPLCAAPPRPRKLLVHSELQH